jgi:dethiobiotin synthetase
LGVLGLEELDGSLDTGGARVAREWPHQPRPTRARDSVRVADAAPEQRRRWLVLGTGTGVGKSFVAQGLVRSLAATGLPSAGLKPIETGLTPGLEELSDAARLGRLSFHVKLPAQHPLYSFAQPVAPARAARSAQHRIEIERIADWVAEVEANASAQVQLVIETAGGVFSPLSDEDTNFDLTRVLDPAIWLLVAPDRLGVLHDVTSCLRAMASLGRSPDYLILSAPEHPDASTGTNADELARQRSMPPIIHIPRHDPAPLAALLKHLLPLRGPEGA